MSLQGMPNGEGQSHAPIFPCQAIVLGLFALGLSKCNLSYSWKITDGTSPWSSPGFYATEEWWDLLFNWSKKTLLNKGYLLYLSCCGYVFGSSRSIYCTVLKWIPSMLSEGEVANCTSSLAGGKLGLPAKCSNFGTYSLRQLQWWQKVGCYLFIFPNF